jgi:hypothetical protein
MRIEPSLSVSGLLLALVLAGPASAQMVTTTEGLTLHNTLTTLLQPTASAAVGEAVAFATALEVNTAPLGTSSGGFVFKFDPTTGLKVRTASTFGPFFAERALTTGAGKMSVGASLSIASYDRLGDFNLQRMQLSNVKAASDTVSRTGNASLVLTSETLTLMGAVGATDDLDLEVAVPMVKVKLDGRAWVQRADNVVSLNATGGGIASGLGDVAVAVKYRFLKFGKELPDPGGLAFMLKGRFPTGDTGNLRGLGITRVLGMLIFSSGTGRFRPHANAGFEWWEKGITVPTGLTPYSTVETRHEVEYNVGAEFEAAPKMTLLIDLLGRNMLKGGRIDLLNYPIPAENPFGVTSFEAAGVTDHAIHKVVLAPGVKWNVKDSVLLMFNARIPLSDNSLYDRFTPVLGVEFTF